MPLKILTLVSQGKEGVGSALEIRVHRDTTLSQVPVLTKSTVLGFTLRQEGITLRQETRITYQAPSLQD